MAAIPAQQVRAHGKAGSTRRAAAGTGGGRRRAAWADVTRCVERLRGNATTSYRDMATPRTSGQRIVEVKSYQTARQSPGLSSATRGQPLEGVADTANDENRADQVLRGVGHVGLPASAAADKRQVHACGSTPARLGSNARAARSTLPRQSPGAAVRVSCRRSRAPSRRSGVETGRRWRRRSRAWRAGVRAPPATPSGRSIEQRSPAARRITFRHGRGFVHVRHGPRWAAPARRAHYPHRRRARAPIVWCGSTK